MMTEQQETDLETMRGAFGLYVAQLTPAETEAFDRLCNDGIASRDYSGVSGALGMSKAILNARRPSAGNITHALQGVGAGV